MKVDAIVLVGGKGTRLAKVVSDRPKPLALIRETPFLDLLITTLKNSLIVENIILATGYKAKQIETHYQSRNVLISEEKEPLGTGGAIKKALPLAKSDPVLIVNGDSYIEVDLRKVLEFHQQKRADMTLVTREVADTSRYGSLSVEDDRITAFAEKKEGRGLMNGGVYLMQKKMLDPFPEGQFLSLEKECLPKLLDKALFSYSSSGYFIDIGTKESYKAAQKELYL